jgi:hypothetical protein
LKTFVSFLIFTFFITGLAVDKPELTHFGHPSIITSAYSNGVASYGDTKDFELFEFHVSLENNISRDFISFKCIEIKASVLFDPKDSLRALLPRSPPDLV